MIDYSGTYTDQYQLSMAQTYFLKGQKNESAVFDYFFRKLPYGSGYAIFAGLDDLIDAIANLRFNECDIDYLSQQNYHPEFIEYLKNFCFNGDIFAVAEGDLVFPNEPILRVSATIIEAQLIETLILNILNFQTLIATKARRIRQVAGKNKRLLEFGLRRAQGTAGLHASKAAIIGGFDATSNVRAGRDYGIDVAGTMAHSYIQSHDSELAAFRDFAAINPDNCVVLVDTYNTLKSGLPNAITLAKEMEKKGKRLKAIRLDSGDLAYLAKKARHMLDDAGLGYVKIAASNQLDEYLIKSLDEQQAPIDIFGIGTNLVIGSPDGALDGVYKLALSGKKARIKLSETITKTTLPDIKQIHRLYDDEGMFLGADCISLIDESTPHAMFHPFEPNKSMEIKAFAQETLLQKIIDKGRRCQPAQTLSTIAAFSEKRMRLLPDEYKRFNYPHLYKIGISRALKEKRDRLIARHKV
ncbi:MAG: nicotinate phosphoribosyltransferase [Francisellaceae bacterium]